MDRIEFIKAWARLGRVPPNWDFLDAAEREIWYVEMRRAYAEERSRQEDVKP